MPFFKRTRFVMVPPGVHPLEDIDTTTIRKGGVSFWIVLACLMLATLCITSVFAMATAKPAGAAGPTATLLASTATATSRPETSATPTITITGTPQLSPSVYPSQTPWIQTAIATREVTRLYAVRVTQLATEIWHIHSTTVVTQLVTQQITREVTRIITATSGATQTPWIVTATYTSTPTATPTPGPSPTVTSTQSRHPPVP